MSLGFKLEVSGLWVQENVEDIAIVYDNTFSIDPPTRTRLLESICTSNTSTENSCLSKSHIWGGICAFIDAILGFVTKY